MNNTTKKIKVVIAAELSPEKIGSLERAIFFVAKLLVQKGFEVKCLFSGALSPEVRHYFALSDEQVVTSLGNLSDEASRKRWLHQFRVEAPHIVWLHFFPLHGFFLYRIRKACSGAVIYSTERVSRGYPKRNFARLVAAQVRERLFRGCIHHHIAVSDFIKYRLHDVDQIPSQKISTIYNGIDTKAFHPTHNEGTYLVAAAYLRSVKGIDVLLEALLILRQQNIEPECKIVGIGPKLERYKAFVKANCLANVSFMGLRNDMPDILRGAMLTVVPSLWAEAFCNVAAESQAAGVPVIASCVGGLPEVVQDGVTGLLVAPGDAAQLAEAIRSLIENQKRRREMAVAARHWAVAQFDLQTQAHKVTSVLTQGYAGQTAEPFSSAVSDEPTERAAFTHKQAVSK